MSQFAYREAKVFFIILALFISIPGYPQDSYLPVPAQYRLILKILTYDKNIKNKQEIVLGILYHEGYSPSVKVRDELKQVMDDLAPKKISGIPISYVPLELHGQGSLSQAIKQKNIYLLYITPMTRGELNTVLKICAENKIPTITGIEAFVGLGVAVGFNRTGQKQNILINPQAVKDQGFDLSARLLRLAKISGKMSQLEEIK